MKIEEAIKKAIEGGWSIKEFLRIRDGFDINLLSANIAQAKAVLYEVLLDRNFWIALGKGMGWEQEREIKTPRLGSNVKIKGEWIHFWYRLIDHLASEKSIESFFESLEKQK